MDQEKEMNLITLINSFHYIKTCRCHSFTIVKTQSFFQKQQGIEPTLHNNINCALALKRALVLEFVLSQALALVFAF